MRALKAEAGLPRPRRCGSTRGETAPVEENLEVFRFLSRADLLPERPAKALVKAMPRVTARMPLEGLLDVEEWRRRQEKRLKELLALAERSQRKLASPASGRRPLRKWWRRRRRGLRRTWSRRKGSGRPSAK